MKFTNSIMANSTQPNKILSSEQLSLLSREELVSQLQKAHEKIQKLEAIYKCGETLCTENDKLVQESVSSYPESLFSYINDEDGSVSVDSLDANLYHNNQKEVINELQLKLQNYQTGDCPKPFHPHYHSDEFIAVFEHKGPFPHCDEDLSMCSSSDDDEESQAHPAIIVDDGSWDDDDNDNRDQFETFPLIPSPVLNTPPYEYIFLTKSNEAKYRIFLNQKLNKVFQEEIQKLQKLEEQLLKGKSHNDFDHDNDNVTHHRQHRNTNHHETHGRMRSNNVNNASVDIDQHNQNNLVTTSSDNEIYSPVSAFNVIHCFDPSDVDLELKKIFMEKPPITHKIVRRKSRRDRGSSVPAVDSYYGTRDLHKVGHASYFIPTLTESERKAIGWKHEYHYGHWKYATLNVPNPKKNQISLHPHVDEANQSKNDPYHHSGTLPQNPLHHHEIDLSEPLFDAVKSKEASKESSHQSPCKHHIHHHHEDENSGNENEDTLSFITLSGCSNEISQSCHIIPDKGTLRCILKWLLPCVKLTEKSNSGSLTATGNQQGEFVDHNKNQAVNTKEKKAKTKRHHEIETLVEPSGKLNFPISHTYISFDTNSDEETHSVQTDLEEDTECDEHENNNEEQISNAQHQYAHHHHHHRRVFHWKKILNASHSSDMSVVGGDVIESIHDYKTASGGHSDVDATDIEIMKDWKRADAEVISLQSGNGLRGCCYEVSSTDSDNENNTEKGTRKKLIRKLKPCRAYTKLLTLKDLGYVTDGIEDESSTSSSSENETEDKNEKTEEMTFPDASSHSDKNRQEYTYNLPHSNNYKVKKSTQETDVQICGDNESEGRHFCLAGITTMHRTLSTEENSSSIDMTDRNYSENLSSVASGLPFSSMSISHQNSAINSNLVMDTEPPSPSMSGTDQELNGFEIETRFLDPKDLLLPPMEKAFGVENTEHIVDDTLPFIFDFYNSQHEVDANFGEQYDDNVIEWMGSEFVDDIKDGLGLLSSCLETLLKHDKLISEKCKSGDAESNHEHSYISDNDEVPEKVDGQHRITTLHDMDHSDIENKND